MSVNFLAPDGSDRCNVTADYIASLVLNSGTEFWESGSGDAAVRFEDEQMDGELILIVRELLGVFVQYTDLDSGEEWVLTNGESEEETVSILQGGEPWELPRTFFVPPQIAVAAVRDFISSGKRSVNYKWSTF